MHTDKALQKAKITAVVLTKNSEDVIQDCLESIKKLDEIVIVDSGSTDSTLKIAKVYKTKIIDKPFTNFTDQRKCGADHASGEWIFYIDSDERATPQLIEALRYASTKEHDLILIPRRNLMFGKWVKYSGWYPDYQQRFIRKSTMVFDNEPVHERVNTRGSRRELPKDGDAVIIHYTCENLGEYIQKMNHYTTLEARAEANSDKYKIGKWAMFSRSWGMFTQTLFHHKGINDGMRGVIIAWINMMTSFMVMSKIWEIRQKSQ
jgi:(heptosyl)LPS beta-1,4-glucosyltransferase